MEDGYFQFLSIHDILQNQRIYLSTRQSCVNQRVLLSILVFYVNQQVWSYSSFDSRFRLHHYVFSFSKRKITVKTWIYYHMMQIFTDAGQYVIRFGSANSGLDPVRGVWLHKWHWFFPCTMLVDISELWLPNFVDWRIECFSSIDTVRESSCCCTCCFTG